MPCAVARVAPALRLALLLPASVGAQLGTIRGRVADSTGVAIGQASVAIEPSGPRVYANDRGEFVISRVPAGQYTLRARRIGYDAPAVDVRISGGETLRQDIVMRRLAVRLAGVDVVVGSRARHTAADELAAPVDVFTPLEIRQQGTTEMAQVLAQLSRR